MDRRIGGKGQKRSAATWSIVFGKSEKVRLSHLVRVVYRTWGTKWNAYHQDFEEPNILWFDTAWNGVPLLIQKLSEIFPDVEFHYAYADEDLGFNTGRGTARNGEINMTIPEGRSNEAFEIMFFVKPGMDEYFELTDEGYKWVS